MINVYMDESGISQHDEVTVVVGLIVNMDYQSAASEEAVRHIHECVPSRHREGFIFHCKDLFSKKYKEIWDFEQRLDIMRGMMSIPRVLNLPVAYGMVRRSGPNDAPAEFGLSKWDADHLLAFSECVTVADRYIRDTATDHEVASIVAEKCLHMEKFLKIVPSVMRLNSPTELPGEFDYSIRKIRNSVYFVEKDVDPISQIADACAFGLRRFFEKKKFGEDFVQHIVGHVPADAFNMDTMANVFALPKDHIQATG